MEFVIKCKAKKPEVKQPEVEPEVKQPEVKQPEVIIPKPTKRSWLSATLILAGIISVSWLICSIGGNSEVGTGDIAVYQTPLDIKTDGNVIRVTSNKITKPYIVVYRNEQEIRVDPIYIGDKTAEIELQTAGSYTMLTVGGNSDSIYYNLSTVTITPDVDYSALRDALTAYFAETEIVDKDKLVPKLKALFTATASRKLGWEEKHTEVYKGVRGILGFDSPRETTEEHKWQAVFGQNGIIDNWVRDNGIELTNESYKQILLAIADGLEVKPVQAEPEPAGGIDEATGIPYVENPVTL